MAATFDVDRGESGTVSLVIAGQLDLTAREELVAHLDRLLAGDRSEDVVIDLDRVDFIDSSGIGALVGAKVGAARDGRTVHVRGARGQVAEVFAMTGVGVILGTVA